MPASQVFSGSGDPNGIIDGNPGDIYQDQTGSAWINTAAPSTWTKIGFASGGGSVPAGYYGFAYQGDQVIAVDTQFTQTTNFHDLTINNGVTVSFGFTNPGGVVIYVDGTL